MLIVVKEIKYLEEEIKDIYGVFQGQMISTMQKVCKSAVLSNSPCLAERMYICNFTITQEYIGKSSYLAEGMDICTFTTTQENIGKLYRVISKRRGI